MYELFEKVILDNGDVKVRHFIIVNPEGVVIAEKISAPYPVSVCFPIESLVDCTRKELRGQGWKNITPKQDRGRNSQEVFAKGHVPTNFMTGKFYMS